MSDDQSWAEPGGGTPPPPPADGVSPVPFDPYAPSPAAGGVPPAEWSPTRHWAELPVYPPRPSSLTARAWTTMALLGITGLLSAIGIVHHLKLGPLMDRVDTGDVDEELMGQLRGWDAAGQGLGIAFLLLFLASGISFIVWLWGARSNLEAYGWTRQRRSPGWAIGAWFVPVVSLWFPFQVVADVWKASHPARPAEQRDLDGLLTGRLLRWWWGFWLLAVVAGGIGGAGSDPQTTTDLRQRSDYLVFDESVLLVTAVLAVLVVRQVSRFQAIRAATPYAWVVDQDTLPRLPKLTAY